MGQVEDIMNAWKKQLDAEMDSKCVTLARQVLQRALYYREQLTANDIGHNYTGNFINSIVCGVWKNGANISILLGSKLVGKPPIMNKMTGKKDGSYRRYVFGEKFRDRMNATDGYPKGVNGPDWSDASSTFLAGIRTNTSKQGVQDAMDFISNFKPHIRKGYVIALGYPVEYAEEMEKYRASTGLALVEDEYNSKVEQIRKFFMFDSEIKSVNSGLSTDIWDEIFAKNTAYKEGVGLNEEEILHNRDFILDQMGRDGFRVQPGLGTNITFVPSDTPTQPTNSQNDDPLGGAPLDDVPF
jgi:hypothetical protein|nr:MAG TPA: hypothetical protein [Caudoviricetes sp.]